jgi:subtilisin-like proprotein convertase family protein
MLGSGATARIVVDATSHPPLRRGAYAVRITNLGDDDASVNVLTSTISDPNPPEPFRFTSTVRQQVPDDAVSASVITVTNSELISSVEVGVRIDHPRVSDLVLRLISPSGDSVLLGENRGAASANLGCNNLVTNVTPVSSAGGPEASTNIMDTGETSGMIAINYDFYTLPDSMHVYYEGNLLFDSGMISGSGSTTLTYGPGLSTELAIVMNEGGNLDSNTAWFYTVTSTRLVPLYLTFTEDTNLAQVPLKFASLPLTNVTFSGPPAGIFYLPEESLEKLTGKNARGQWTLELSDSREGATSPVPTLISWQLAFKFQNAIPKPIPLTGGSPSTNWVGPGQVQWFSIDAPAWVSFATNSILSASIPINLLFNQSAPPTGTNAGDFFLGANVVGVMAVLQTNGSPPLLPASSYYLGVQNTNAVTAAFTLSVDFDVHSVITLQSGVSILNTNLGPLHTADYYHFVVTPNAARVQFEINGPTADLTLVARKGLPLPSLDRYDLLSANPGTNDELLVLYDFSQPVPLTPGDWYLAAINASGTATAYSILATEFPVNGTNIVLSYPVVTADSLCVTWTSLPGVHYRVQGKASLNDPDWTTLGPTVTATDFIASFCLPLPSPIHFLRIEEGLVLVTPPIVISRIIWSPAGTSLDWTSPASSRFQVEWSTGSTSPLEWNYFTNTVTSSDGSFSFFDDGSQTHGRDPIRFYRLLQLP